MATPWPLTAALGREHDQEGLGPPRPVSRLRAVIRPVDVLQLRVYGDPTAMIAVAEGLGDLAGARHVAVASNDRRGTALVTAYVGRDAADAALAFLARLGSPAAVVVFARLATTGAGSYQAEPLALVW